MSTPTIDLSVLNGVPPGAPLQMSDLLVIGRPTPVSSPATPMIPYAITVGQLAAAVLTQLAPYLLTNLPRQIPTSPGQLWLNGNSVQIS